MIFFKIKVNACILKHPINNYNFFGESFKNTLIYLYCIFFLILQVSNSFEYTNVMATDVATTAYPLNFRRQIGTQRPSTTTKNTKMLNPKFSKCKKNFLWQATMRKNLLRQTKNPNVHHPSNTQACQRKLERRNNAFIFSLPTLDTLVQ